MTDAMTDTMTDAATDAMTDAMTAPRCIVDVSGATALRGPDGPIELRSKERSIVAAIALHHPEPVGAASLAPLVWGDEIPMSALKSIHNHVSRIRRAVPDLIETSPHGYRFAEFVSVVSSGEPTSFADLADQPQLMVVRAKQRRRALELAEEHVLHELRHGATDDLAALLARLVADAPHRLNRWWYHAVVTARLGRRQEALEILRGCRRWHVRSDADSAAQRALSQLERAIIADDLFIDSPAALAPQAFGADGTLARSLDSIRGLGTGDGLIDPTGVIGELVHALDRSAGSFHLTAPAGGGKTSAISSVVALLPPLGWHCFVTSCSPTATDPLMPIHQLADARRERHGPLVADEALARRPIGGAGGDHASALFDALIAPATRRVLLVVDDLHEADPSMRSYVQRLVEVAAQAGDHVATLVASRPQDDADSLGIEVQLVPWDRAAIVDYLAAFVVPGVWSDGAADWIDRISSGNPLYVRELTIDALLHVPDDPTTVPFVAPVAPTRLERSASEHRLGDLPPTALHTLHVAAVLGDEFRLDDLTRLEPGAATSLAIAEARGIIDEFDDDRFRFVHQSFRQSILDTLAESDLVALSRQAATTIGRSADRHERLGELARLARAAASTDPELAITTTIDQMQHAHDAQRYEEALSLARLALTMIEPVEGRSARWCSTAVMAGGLGIDVGEPDATALLESAGFRAIELEAHDIVGDAVWYLCGLSQATSIGVIESTQAHLLEYALEHVTTPAVRARACAGGSFAWGLTDDAATSRRLFLEAEAVSRRCGDPTVRADVLLRAFTPLSSPDDVPVRRQISAELHELGTRTHRLEFTYEACRLDLGDSIHWGTGDPRSSMKRIEHIAQRLNQRGRNWSLCAFRSTIALLDGDVELAEHHASKLTSDEVTASPQLVLSTYGAHMIAIRLAQGRIDELDPLVATLTIEQPELRIWQAVRCLTASTVEPDTARLAFDAVFDAASDAEFGGGSKGSRHRLPENFTLVSGLTVAGEGAWRLGDEERIDTMIRHLTPFADRWAWFNVGTVGPVDLTLARLHAALDDEQAARTCAYRGLRSTSRVGAPLFADQLAQLLAGLDS